MANIRSKARSAGIRRKTMELYTKSPPTNTATASVAKARPTTTTSTYTKKGRNAQPIEAAKAKPIEREAKQTVKAAKKTVKAAVKTVKKAIKKTAGSPLKERNTYTTSGTHAGGRKSSASRKIKRATSLKKNRGTSLRLQ